MKRPIGVHKIDGKMMYFVDYQRNRLYIFRIEHTEDKAAWKKENSYFILHLVEVYKYTSTEHLLDNYVADRFEFTPGVPQKFKVKSENGITYRYSISEAVQLVVEWEPISVIIFDVDWPRNTIYMTTNTCGDGLTGGPNFEVSSLTKQGVESLSAFINVLGEMMKGREDLIDDNINFQDCKVIAVTGWESGDRDLRKERMEREEEMKKSLEASRQAQVQKQKEEEASRMVLADFLKATQSLMSKNALPDDMKALDVNDRISKILELIDEDTQNIANFQQDDKKTKKGKGST